MPAVHAVDTAESATYEQLEKISVDVSAFPQAEFFQVMVRLLCRLSSHSLSIRSHCITAPLQRALSSAAHGTAQGQGRALYVLLILPAEPPGVENVGKEATTT